MAESLSAFEIYKKEKEGEDEGITKNKGKKRKRKIESAGDSITSSNVRKCLALVFFNLFYYRVRGRRKGKREQNLKKLTVLM